MNQNALNNSPHWMQIYRDSFKDRESFSNFMEIDTIPKLDFDFFITRNFAAKIKKAGPKSVLWKQFIPQAIESDNNGLINPIGDVNYSKGGGIIHRYGSRILFTPTTNCPVICRYCFRKNELTNKEKIFQTNLATLSKYLNSHPGVNEVILTGGDPLILSDNKIEKIAMEIAKHKHVKFLRLHSRTPVIIPERLDSDFHLLMNKISPYFTKVILCIHTNHVDELDQQASAAIEQLIQKTKIDVKSQTVLLKGINNSVNDITELCLKLVALGIAPYYLHHPDLVKGGMHYYLPLEEGRQIYLKLREKLSGWMIPQYIIDQPGGRGKQSAFNPESIEFSGEILDRFGEKNKYSPTMAKKEAK